MPDALLKEERQKLILESLEDNNRVTVPELAARFGASEVTIRRDLAGLAAGGKLIRAHRGALKLTPAPPEAPVVQRMALERELKERVAAAAADLVSDGDALFIGSGSTMALFARRLAARQRLTIFTNALNIAADLAGGPFTVVLTGGVLRGAELSLLGHIAELTLPEVRVGRVFMGAQALSLEDGWTTDQLAEVQTTRSIFAMAPELVIAADHTKLGRTAAARIAPLERITTLVTDAEADAGFLKEAAARGLRVLTA